MFESTTVKGLKIPMSRNSVKRQASTKTLANLMQFVIRLLLTRYYQAIAFLKVYAGHERDEEVRGLRHDRSANHE